MHKMADCVLCEMPILDGPHEHHWRYIPNWSVTICAICSRGNHDGIVLEMHPLLKNHLENLGIKIEFNEKGWLDIP
jgi:hypothetical protein